MQDTVIDEQDSSILSHISASADHFQNKGVADSKRLSEPQLGFWPHLQDTVTVFQIIRLFVIFIYSPCTRAGLE